MKENHMKSKSPIIKHRVGRPAGQPESARSKRARRLVAAKLAIRAKIAKEGIGAKIISEAAIADAIESQSISARMIAKANQAKAELQLRRLQLESGDMIKKETAVVYMTNLFRMIRRNLDNAPEMVSALSDLEPEEADRLRFQLMRVTERLRKKLAEIPAIITDEALSSGTVSERRANP